MPSFLLLMKIIFLVDKIHNEVFQQSISTFISSYIQLKPWIVIIGNKTFHNSLNFLVGWKMTTLVQNPNLRSVRCPKFCKRLSNDAHSINEAQLFVGHGTVFYFSSLGCQ